MDPVAELLALASAAPIEGSAPDALSVAAAAIPDADLPAALEAIEGAARTAAETISTSPDPVAVADQVERLASVATMLRARVASNQAAAGRVADALASMAPPVVDAPAPAPEAVTAAALVRNVRPADPEPPADPSRPRHALVAAAGLDLAPAGHEFTDALSFSTEMSAALNRLQPAGVGQAAARQIVGAIRNYDRPVVLGDDGNLNEAALLDVQRRFQRGDLSSSAITAASGPFCAPAEPIYEMFNLPIGGLAAWPTVDAPRGRRTYPVSPSLVDITGDWLSMLGSQASPKPCFVVECGDTVDGSVVSYPLCLTFDNFTGRFYPELVTDRIAKSIARFGFVVQAALLNTIETSLSTDLAIVDSGGGFLVAIARALRAAGARYRSRYFMPPGSPLDVLLPAWVPDAVAVDIISRDSTQDYATTVAQITTVLETGGFNIQWLNGWQQIPDTGWEATDLNALMYAPGTLVRLSGGDLNLGVQRDSTLNSLNQYQIFQETWDGIVRVGYGVDRLTGIKVCANGETGNRAEILCDTLVAGS